MSQSLSIGYFGHGRWAHNALRAILDEPGFSVAFVATRRVGDNVLESLAAKAGVPFLVPEAINRANCAAQLLGFDADLFVSMSFDQIFRRPLMDGPRLGTINCHAGALPFYRGRNILNWAVINGETKIGITVHQVDDGIDTGDILRQDFLPVGPDMTYGELLEEVHYACANTLLNALRDIQAGKSVPRRQADIHPVGLYCGRRGPGDEWIDWRQTSKRIHDFVRGLSAPDLYARTLLDGKTLAIARTKMIADAPIYLGTPGEVVGRDDDGIVVKTGDSTLRVLDVGEIAADGSIAIARPRYKIGLRFAAGVRKHEI
jgi:methionyl-tRNA formyltransferase